MLLSAVVDGKIVEFKFEMRLRSLFVVVLVTTDNDRYQPTRAIARERF